MATVPKSAAPTESTTPVEASATAEPAAPQTVQAAVTKNVTFTSTFRSYHRGDTAGFPSAYADQLVAKGVAVPARTLAVDAMIRK